MDLWFDEQISRGVEIRDSTARDKAKEVAQGLGFLAERFKASAKWLDKFKERRRLAGKLNSVSNNGVFGFYQYNNPYGTTPMAPQAIGLQRSQSAMTMSSSDSSSQSIFQQSPHSNLVPTPEIVTPYHHNQSEPDLVQLGAIPSTRQRSQSSPQIIGEPGGQSPSSGKASRSVRPSPLSLHRQNSYHGSSPSPRRPAPLARANTSQIGVARRSRPTSLAASAFGITPIHAEEAHGDSSAMVSPGLATTSAHSRAASEASLAPFANSMGGMTISPTMSDTADIGSAVTQPITPMTPGNGSIRSVFTASDYSESSATNEFGVQSNMPRADALHGQYATMPNKHYGAQQYTQQGWDFKPVPGSSQQAQAWQ